jgi:putative inorganic carbon (HCO3(-)) transporter
MHRLHAVTNLLDHPSPAHLLALLALTVIVACLLWLVARLDVSLIFSIGFALESFSGNWKYIPFPVPVDRVILVLALLILFLRGAGTIGAYKVRIQPIHFLLFGVAVYVIANALWFGTLTSSYGFYALLDRLGVIPFLMYTLAPVLFGTERQRNYLLVILVALGVYLGVDALLEGAGVTSLVFPHYITNDSIGITAGRARGPFLASDAMGLALFDCSVFSAIALKSWRSGISRAICKGVILLGAIGIFFTLTRSVWIGGVLGVVAGMAVDRNLRRHLPKVLVLGVVAVVAALLLVPGLSTKVDGRVGTKSSVWDRYNTNDAAVRVIEAHPLFGIGWQTFETKGVAYLRQAGSYPLTGEGLEVHNVFLSHFAEIGIFGGLLWALALFSGVGGSLLRRGPPELLPWRIGLLSMVIVFLVVANLGPLSYPLPNLLLWLMAGIVARDRNSVVRDEEEDVRSDRVPVQTAK